MFSFEELPPLIREFAAYKMTIQGRSVKTGYNYSLDLLTFFKFVLKTRDKSFDEKTADLDSLINAELAASVRESDVYTYLLHCASANKNMANSRARKLSSIKSFYKYLTVNAKLCKDNPAKNIESPKIPKTLPKFLTLQESIGFLEAVKQYGGENEPRDTAIFTLFLNCGMRLSELCGISLSDITPDLEKVVITGKGSKQRTLYLNESCRNALRRWLKQRNGMPCSDPDALWVSRNNDRLTYRAVQYNMQKYLLAAGLRHKHLSVHKLRHTAATLMYSTGKVDVRILKDILGHEQLNTTQIYTHVSNEQVKQAMELNPLSSAAAKEDEEEKTEE